MLEQLKTNRWAQVMVVGLAAAACFAGTAVGSAVFLLASSAKEQAKPAFSLMLPQEVTSEGWTFSLNRVDFLEVIEDEGESYTPENGVFLILIGAARREGGSGCLKGQDFTLRDGSRSYQMERAVLEAAKDVYHLDYPGMRLGQCIGEGETEPTFLVFDAPREAGDARLYFKQGEMRIGAVGPLLAATPAVAPATDRPVPPVVDTPEPTSTATAMVADTPLPEPTATLTRLFTSTSEPTLPADTPTPASPEERLRAAIVAALGEGNRGIERVEKVEMNLDVINVKWAIDDNLTDEMIKRSARYDISRMLKAIQETGVAYYIVNFEGTFSMIDQLGNTEERSVVWATYGSETVEQINWDRFLLDNMYDVASTHKLHPAFEE